ncbi:uncharacterized protein RSE6_08038 [Rhynchosporium secalis]|uniref:Uncharacterized protein n=1 Tax=Rhynchosporium secalis TaxID=38038 RepID=A0A1E1MFG5_RHYSE|nr:uncharacterized protein RSE6_08038 [Rhynchosporium secalis]
MSQIERSIQRISGPSTALYYKWRKASAQLGKRTSKDFRANYINMSSESSYLK